MAVLRDLLEGETPIVTGGRDWYPVNVSGLPPYVYLVLPPDDSGSNALQVLASNTLPIVPSFVDALTNFTGSLA